MSPPLDVKELSGAEGPVDPDCLHCYLAQTIERWSDAHPKKDLSEMVLEVAEVLGELAASDMVESDHREFVLSLGQVAGHMMTTATQMRAEIVKRLAVAAAKARAH